MATKLEFDGTLRSYISDSTYDKPNIWTPEILTIHSEGSIYLEKYQKAFTLASFEWCFTSTNGNGPGLARLQIFKDNQQVVLDQNTNYPGGGTSGWKKYDFAPGFDIDIQITLNGASDAQRPGSFLYNEHVKLEVRNIMVGLINA